MNGIGLHKLEFAKHTDLEVPKDLKFVNIFKGFSINQSFSRGSSTTVLVMLGRAITFALHMTLV